MTNNEKVKTRQVYLGDSVYADFVNGNFIVLTTQNGMGASNTIYLEPEVVENLVDYIESIYGKRL